MLHILGSKSILGYCLGDAKLSLCCRRDPGSNPQEDFVSFNLHLLFVMYISSPNLSNRTIFTINL